MKRTTFKNFFITFAKLAITVLLIFWLIKSDKINFAVLAKIIDVQFLAVGLLLIGGSFLLATERWRQFLKIQSCDLPFGLALRLTLIGIFFNFVMPGGVGGDLVKGYYVTRFSDSRRAGTAMTVLLDRLIGLLAILMISIFAMVLNLETVLQKPSLTLTLGLVLAMTLGISLLWLIVFSRRVFRWPVFRKVLTSLPKSGFLLRLYDSLEDYGDIKKVFFTTLGMSILGQVLVLTFYIYAGSHMGFQIPIQIYLLAAPIAFVVQAIPISPGGVGVGQAATFFLFDQLQNGSGVAGSSTTTAHQFIAFVFGIFGAIFYVILTHQIKTNSGKGARNDSAAKATL